MAKVNMQSKVNVGADMLWNTIGGFNALPAWHPAFKSSQATGEKEGSTRTLDLVGGGQIVERLETVSKTEKRYRYSILSSPLPIANYEAELLRQGQRRRHLDGHVEQRVPARRCGRRRCGEADPGCLSGRLRQPAQDVWRVSASKHR